MSPPPSHRFHQPCQGPRAARKVASYRNHPPVPEPRESIAEGESGEAEEGRGGGGGGVGGHQRPANGPTPADGRPPPPVLLP